MTPWDRVVDVVVLGSGAAGLTAATLAHDGGAEVLLLEKSALIGGTTGVSGGMPWVPLNHHLGAVGVQDSRDEALAYIHRLTQGREPDPDLIEVFVDRAPEMVEYLEAHTPLRFFPPGSFSDYYADLPGGKPRGRSLEPQPFAATDELGDWAGRLRTSPVMPPMTLEEGGVAAKGGGGGIDMELLAKRQAAGILTMGGALVAALLRGLLDREVACLTSAPASGLVLDGDGAVAGVTAETGGESLRVGARKGVVIATGGFEWDPGLVKAFLGSEVRPLSPPYNTGDGLVMALGAGAAVANMASAWWYPAMQDPTIDYEGRPLFLLGSGRNLPGSITVNHHGRRFVNEGATYQDMPRSFTAFDPVAQEYPNQAPVWMVFDQRLKDRAVIATLLPGVDAPEWVDRSADLRGLAGRIGVDPDGLEETVSRFNEHARRGEDPEFGRGTTWWEGFMTGGPDPRRCLAPIETPPFYALPIHLGVLGTNGGPLVDEQARVRRMRGGVVPGLYAAGNAAASVFGPAYPAGGATLGPAMTFGYIAGGAVAAEAARNLG